MPLSRNANEDAPRKKLIVVMSADAVAAALVGALVETLGYEVHFNQPAEDPTTTLRRERPDVVLLDGSDASLIADAVLGHAAMRDISVVVFGPRRVLDALKGLGERHRIFLLVAPPSLEDVAGVLASVFASRTGTSARKSPRIR